MNGQDAKEFIRFYVFEWIHCFNDMIHNESIHLIFKTKVNRFKNKKFMNANTFEILTQPQRASKYILNKSR